MLLGVLVQGFVRATMDVQISLLIAFQPQRADSHRAVDWRLGNRTHAPGLAIKA